MNEIDSSSREYMVAQLKERVCRVIFKKVNGEERDMTCTLMADVLPDAKKDEPLTQKKVRAINEEVIVAFDQEKSEYRSFSVANVISFT